MSHPYDLCVKSKLKLIYFIRNTEKIKGIRKIFESYMH